MTALRTRVLVAALSGAALAAAAHAVVRTAPTPVAAIAKRHAALHISNRALPAAQQDGALRARVTEDLLELGVSADHAFYDRRGDTWATLLPAVPLVPGSGEGNALQWDRFGGAPAGSRELAAAAATALREFLTAHARAWRLDPSELGPARVQAHADGDLVQVIFPRRVGGLAVRDSFLTAVVNHGNLVLAGTRNWGPVRILTIPALSAEAATAALAGYAGGLAPVGYDAPPALEIVALAAPAGFAPGAGYDYRLTWVLRPRFAADAGSWEALVDAASGEILALTDLNQYSSTRKVTGGVFPVSNDGEVVAGVPDGIEQAGYPMPFATITGSAPATTSRGGTLACHEGPITTDLTGPFVRIADLCGPHLEPSASGDLDLGTSPGTDCETPPAPPPPPVSKRSTHAARTGFYELNRIAEQARGWLPENPWLRAPLLATMNVNSGPTLCNAFWDNVTGSVAFFRYADDPNPLTNLDCYNTGEIAAVFDHEWGHGLDDNDVNGTISQPGESIADTYALLRLHSSCIGRGFFDVQCSGYGDTCTQCTGVRDVDWGKHACNQPHDLDWVFSPYIEVLPPGIPACGGCENLPGGEATGVGPCGMETHCEGYLPAEATWDIVARDLPAMGLDANTAFEVAARLVYTGAGVVHNWYQCDAASESGDGCNADGGYLNFLAADDDDGNLANGTPHMAALHGAFARHQIACNAPAVQTAGCAAGPSAAPVATLTPFDQGMRIEWTPVPGAARYWVFRTEGIHGCNFGKVRIGETTGTEFFDRDLLNGRAYSYGVLAVGASSACMGPMSACATATPVPTPNLEVNAATWSDSIGDHDRFLDNCESGVVAIDVRSIGTGVLTHPRLAAVVPLSHPGIVITSALPQEIDAALAECGTGQVAFALAAGAAGLSPGETVSFRIELTSDELEALDRRVVATVALLAAESDFQFVAEKLWSFESDREGWQVHSGTFAPALAGGGAQATAGYLASSLGLANQCDNIRSPLLALTATSTLSLWNQFDIEPANDSGNWQDRANLGIYDLVSESRTPRSPEPTGRSYNALGFAGSCVTNGQPGWAGPGPQWLESQWSAAALGSGTGAGRLVRLDVGYGTNRLTSGTGFRFDEVRLTDVNLVIPDARADGICLPVANPQAVSTPEDSELEITLTGSNATSFAVATAPGHGDLGGAAPAVDYQPDPDFFGGDSFSFTAANAFGVSSPAAVSIEVLPVNDPPIAIADAYATAERETLAVAAAAGVIANDQDVDGDVLSVALLDGPASGALDLQTDGAFTFDAAPCGEGDSGFTYTLSDGHGGTATAAVTVAITPDAGHCFHTAAPCRIFDSRPGPPIGSGSSREADVTACGVPATAVAVAVNVTVIAPTGAGFLDVHTGPGLSGTSVLSFAAGQTRASNAVVAAALGLVRFRGELTPPSASYHLAIDVVGWFE